MSKDRDFPGGSVIKNLPASAGDMGSIPDLGGYHMLRSTLSSRAAAAEPTLQSLGAVSIEPMRHSYLRH